MTPPNMPQNKPQEWTKGKLSVIADPVGEYNGAFKLASSEDGFLALQSAGKRSSEAAEAIIHRAADCWNALANRNPAALEGLVDALKECHTPIVGGPKAAYARLRQINELTRAALANFNKPSE